MHRVLPCGALCVGPSAQLPCRFRVSSPISPPPPTRSPSVVIANSVCCCCSLVTCALELMLSVTTPSFRSLCRRVWLGRVKRDRHSLSCPPKPLSVRWFLDFVIPADGSCLPETLLSAWSGLISPFFTGP